MTAQKIDKLVFGRFSRLIALLFNRATMYQTDHPYVKQTIEDFHESVQEMLKFVSPLVFIMHKDHLFIDEEPLDPRISVGRIVAHFKKAEIQSVSFERGLHKNELKAFLDILTSLEKYPNADSMKQAMVARGIENLKLNHVFYRKVTEDDEVVSQEALQSMTPSLGDDAQSRRLFINMLLENILAEELEHTFSMESLLKNPAALSRNMVENDLAGARQAEEQELGAGPVLLRQLEIMQQTVEDGLESGEGVDLKEMASALFEMKRHLVEEMGARKAEEVRYSGEEEIVDQARRLADEVVLQLVRRECGAREGGTASLSQLLREVVPDKEELKRLAPHIKAVVMEKSLNVDNLVKDPAVLSKNMVEADAAASRGRGGGKGAGSILMRQLDVLGEEVDERLESEGGARLEDVAAAVMELKRQLVVSMESQKDSGVSYSEEEVILGRVNELSDKVLLELIGEEYRAGEISTSRMAQIIRRLIPEPAEIKRLLPAIRATLLKEGMSHSDWQILVDGLGKELQSEHLAEILRAGSEEIGVDAGILVEEMEQSPVESAELLYLAGEIRKAGGDEKALTEILVDYVEKLGARATEEGPKEEGHLRHVLSGIESQVLGRLKNMDVQSDLLERLEDRLNSRMEEIMEKVKADMVRTPKRGKKGEEDDADWSVLQVIQQSVGESTELGQVLEMVRFKAEAGEVDANDFGQIHESILQIKKEMEDEEANRVMPAGVVNAFTLKLLVKKEISKAKRYGTPFAALSFSLISARLDKEKPPPDPPLTAEALREAVLQKLALMVRDSDVVGLLERNKLVALLPMTMPSGSRITLRRCLKRLHVEPLEVNGAPVEVKVAGVVTNFDAIYTPDSDAFLDSLSKDLTHMSMRIKNIQAYF